MESSAASQKALKRRILRERRRSLAGPAQRAAGRNVAEIINKNVRIRDFRTIAGYVAQDGELDPAPALELFRDAGIQILLPRTGPDRSLEFAPEGNLEPSGPAGISEPTGSAVPIPEISTPAIILVPCVALTPAGGRLGRGGGFYDRALSDLRAAGWLIFGLCHEEALTNHLPLEPHDQAVDWCLTEKRLLSVVGVRE